MISEIAGAFSSLKAATDIALGLSATSTQAAVDEAKIGLQRHLLEAQQAIFAAQAVQVEQAKKIADLEAEISRLRSWETEKARYELKQYDNGALAYELKAEEAGGEPPHQLCPNCFLEGAKSYLQPTGGLKAGAKATGCPRCKSSFASGAKHNVYI
jgi:Zn finger protein HypA/HybF involved in hydrogenase expression